MTKRIVSTDLLMQPIAQFSFGMRAGSIVRIGATAGTDSARRMAGSTVGLADAGAQSDAMLANIATSLGLLGGEVADIIHLRSYMNDWRDLPAYDSALRRCWPDWKGCHSVVGSLGFPLPQAAVEAEALAVIGAARKDLHVDRLPAAPCGGSNAGAFAGTHHVCSVGPGSVSGPLSRDPADQAATVLDHLEAALEVAGLGFRDLVMLNVSAADIRDLPAFDTAMRRRWPPPYPARSACGIGLAHPGWLFSLEATAVKGGGVPVEIDHAGDDCGPASAAILAGDELFIGGQSGVHTADPGKTGEQTARAWSRIHALLDAAGMGADDIVHTTNTLVDWRDYAEFNAAYGPRLQAPYPPRATVLANLPHRGARIMVEAQAHRAARDGLFIGYAPPAA